jgi:transcriptional regulator with XRE-family HTH domain
MDIDEFKRRFGLRVQALRKHKKLTQEDLAEKIDRSVDTVSNVERGVSSTRIETAYRIAEVLGVDIYELFDVRPVDVADRERRQLIEKLIDLACSEDVDTLAAIINQAEILLRMKGK